MFSLDDRAIQYPHAEVERVPPAILNSCLLAVKIDYNLLYSGVIPLLVILLTTVVIAPSPPNDRFHKPQVTAISLLTALFLTSLITDISKNAIGRPRPDLLARCKPAKGTPQHELVSYTVCTEKSHHTLHDGWRSFPSGHSSFAFAGLGYLSLFFAGQLHVFRARTDLLRVILALVPAMCAAMIAISRCEDYRHDVYDVTTGSIIGMSLAYFSYRRHYPALRDRRCDIPHPSLDEAGGLERMRTDEEARVGVRVADVVGDDDSEVVPLREGRRNSGLE
ncbi:MAG: hypothetical protein L6R37_001733 [Teloschistes peruensis]|nr:MAG: hypothetical protein L6R37_001733 [Teloschistes peruensis]